MKPSDEALETNVPIPSDDLPLVEQPTRKRKFKTLELFDAKNKDAVIDLTRDWITVSSSDYDNYH